MADGLTAVQRLLHEIQKQHPKIGTFPLRRRHRRSAGRAPRRRTSDTPEADPLQAETPPYLTCRAPDAQAASAQRWQSTVAEEEERRAFADAAASETARGTGRGSAFPGAPPRASSQCTPH